jgi:hypothetical protein
MFVNVPISSLGCNGKRDMSPLTMLFALLVALSAFPQRVAAGDPAPLKLQVLAPQEGVKVGDIANLQLSLRDYENKPVAAPEPLKVQVEVVSPSSKSNTVETTMAPGTSQTTISVPLLEEGVSTVTARQPMLLDGGALLVGTNSPSSGPASGVPVPNWTLTRDEGGGKLLARAEVVEQNSSLVGFEENSSANVTLRYTPQRNLQADGKDEATIYVILDETNQSGHGLTFDLFSSIGELGSKSVIIPPGKSFTTTQLVSTNGGTAAVEIIGHSAGQDSKSVSITFQKPISSIHLLASPPVASLIDTPEILAQLLGPDGNLIEADRPRKISFAIEHGDGKITPVDLDIETGEAVARAVFAPSTIGGVTISGSTPNLFSQKTEIEIFHKRQRLKFGYLFSS